MTSADGGAWEQGAVPAGDRDRLLLRKIIADAGDFNFVAVGDWFGDSQPENQKLKGAIFVADGLSNGWTPWIFLEPNGDIRLEPTAIAYSATLGLYVVIAYTTIYRSTDLINWSKIELSNTTIPPEAQTGWGHGAFDDIVFSESLGLFLAVDYSPSSRVIISPDAINWTYVKVRPGSDGYNSVCWSESLGLFVIPTVGGVLVSSSGTGWTFVPIQASMVVGFSNAFWASGAGAGGNGLFVATGSVEGGEGGGPMTNFVATSSDGYEWTVRTTDVAMGPGCWSPELKRFAVLSDSAVVTSGGSVVAVDRSASAVLSSTGMVLSADSAGVDSQVIWDEDRKALAYRALKPEWSVGRVWELAWSKNTNDSTMEFLSVAYSPIGKMGAFVAVGFQGFAVSPDGNEWSFSEVQTEQGNMSNPGVGGPSSICYSPELQIFVACGSTQNPDGSIGYASFWRSNGGPYNWLRNDVVAPTPSGFELRTIVWCAERGIFVAVGSLGSAFVSGDGEDWAEVELPTIGAWGLAWSPQNSRFVATCNTQTSQVFTSGDGLGWTAIPTVEGSQPHTGICWAAELERFIAVGWDGGVVESYDGINWTPQRIYNGSANYLYGICWSPQAGLLVAVAESTQAPISISSGHGVGVPNRMGWTRITSPGLYHNGDVSVENFYSICYGADVETFVAVGSAIITSGARHPRPIAEPSVPPSGPCTTLSLLREQSDIDLLPSSFSVSAVSIAGGSGSGLTLDFTWQDSNFAAINVVSGGSGYRIGNIVHYVVFVEPGLFAWMRWLVESVF
jgi:hypothetical protein